MKAEFEISKRVSVEIKSIEVKAGVRFWEDATVNGVEDKDGTLIPFRSGEYWNPIISLDDGKIENWPDGMVAQIHYKVCDDGEYWLLDKNGRRVAKWSGYYVPNKFLCHGDNGYGDYIVMNVIGDGRILDYMAPEIKGCPCDDCNDHEWKFIE